MKNNKRVFMRQDLMLMQQVQHLWRFNIILLIKNIKIHKNCYKWIWKINCNNSKSNKQIKVIKTKIKEKIKTYSKSKINQRKTKKKCKIKTFRILQLF